MKIIIGCIMGAILFGTTGLLYYLGDTDLFPRFLVYSEAFFASVLVWLGLGKIQPRETKTEKQDLLDELLLGNSSTH